MLNSKQTMSDRITILNNQIDIIINVLKYAKSRRLRIHELSDILSNITNEVISVTDLIKIVDAQNILQRQGHRLRLQTKVISEVKEQFVVLEEG